MVDLAPPLPPRLVRRVLALSLAGSLALAACSAGTSPSGTAAGTSSASESSAPASTTPAPEDGLQPSAVPTALDFVAEDLDGQEFRAADLAGAPAVLWFWAPWCTVCARSAAEVREVAAANPDVRFVGVAGLASDRDAMQDFVRRGDVGGLTHLADLDGSLYARFGISQQHSFVLVAADGSTTTEVAYGGQVDLADLVAQTFG